jgi:hypothetical protein
MRRLTVVMFGAVALLALVRVVSLRAQLPSEPAGHVVGAGNFIHVVADADKSQAFYQDIIGSDAQGGRAGAAATPPPAQRPWTDRADVLRLYNAVNVKQFRNGGAGVPEQPMRVEIMEFADPSRTAVHPRFQDPGAATIVFTVRDLDAVLARVKQNNVPIVSAGGNPVTTSTADGASMRALIVKDPDGFYVELVQRTPMPPSTAPPERNVIDVGFAFTVSDTTRMMRVFQEALGFHVDSSAFRADQPLLSLAGIRGQGVEVRRTTTVVPGSSTRLEFFEFKNVDRKAVAQTTTRDPGTAVLRLRVKDIDDMIQRLAAVGVTVTSAGGKPIDVTINTSSQRFAITSAPDNLFIQIVQQP